MSGLASSLPGKIWEELLRHGHPRSWERGDVLLRQGDRGTHVLLLISGRVKIVRSEPDGRELLLALRGPGEVLGELAVLGESSRTATVTAQTVCQGQVVPAESFLRVLTDTRQMQAVTSHVVKRWVQREDVMADLVDLPAGQRLARLLLRLARGLTPTGGKSVPVDIALSQEDLAKGTGLSRSAVADELGKMRKLGLVRTQRCHVYLCDLPGLKALCHLNDPGES